MGCISSKHVVIATLSPIHDSSLTLADDDKAARRFPNPNQNQDYGQGKFKQETEDDDDDDKISNDDDPVGDVVVQHSPKKPAFSLSTRFGRSTVAEHVAAGWPAWLSAVAGEAIDGWVPQKSDNFERFEKVIIYHFSFLRSQTFIHSSSFFTSRLDKEHTVVSIVHAISEVVK